MENNELINNKTIPDLLPEEELLYYFKRLNDGEKEFRNIIITSSLRLVYNRIKFRFNRTGYTFKEIFNIGVIGLIKSVDTFDINKKNKFSTYADVCIDNEILMFLKKEKKHSNILSIYSCEEDDEENNFIRDTLEDKTQNFSLKYELKDQFLQIDKIVEQLPGKEREIIKLYFGFYGKIYSQDEIAKLYNFSQSYASRFIRKILLKLKIELVKNKIIEERTIPQKVKNRNNYCIN